MKLFNSFRFKGYSFSFILLLMAFLFSPSPASSQNLEVLGREINKVRQLIKDNPSIRNMDEVSLRILLTKNGIPEELIEKVIDQQKDIAKQKNNVEPIAVKYNRNNPAPLAATCSQLGGDNGWGQWTAQTGVISESGGFFTPLVVTITWSGATTTAPRFNLTAGAGNDACTPGGGGPPVPVVSPGFGTASLQLGQLQTAGGYAEQVSTPFTVTAADKNFIYSYAIVLENASGHTYAEEPYAEIYMLDQAGDTVPCSHRRYTGDTLGGIPQGMYVGGGTCQATNGDVAYQPWTLVGVNLTNYVGQTITIHIVNSDCAQGGHFCQSYWDFTCDPLTNSNASFCIGQSVTLTAPSDPHINYGYQWSHNGTPYTGPPNATSQSITPTPAPGDTFTVLIINGTAGCNFKIPYVPKPNGAIANFNFTTSCGGVTTFTDSSYVPIGGATVTGHNWTFPSGTPATATTPTASVTFPPGTYSVTLIVTSSSGCKDTIIKTVNTTGTPLAAFSSTTVCVGDSTHLTDLTVPVAGDPFVAWNWTLPGGSPAVSTQSTVVSSLFTAGTHSVTLVVTTQAGCHNTITLPVNINGLPVPNFTSPPVCAGNITTITNTSTPYAGDPITQTNWTFPGGNPATSASASPTVTFPIGTYTVSLVTVSAAGCKDSTKVPVTVNPPPVAGLKGTNACFNNQNSFTDLSVGNNTISTWGWNFGNGNTSALQNPAHTFSTPGVHTVTLVVTNNFGCKDTNTINVVVNPLPVVNFTSVPVCKGDSTCFTNTSTISSGTITGWAWNFGDLPSGTANTSTAQAPCHVFTGLGPYNVVLTATSDSTCQSNVTLPATINPIPVENIVPQNSCVNTPSNFTSSVTSGGPITSWQWDFNGDGVTDATGQSPSHVYTTAGNYTVTLIVANAGGCKDTVSVPVKAYAPPVANFTGTISGCAPICNQYTDASTTTDGVITSYAWNFSGGNPSSSSQQNPNVCYSNPGTYGASLLITTNFGCKDSISQNPLVNVYAWPTAAFCLSPDQAPTTDPTFSFCNLWSSDVVQWTWNFGDNDTDIVNTSPIHSYSAVVTNNDFYSFKVCVDVKNQHGCWDSICHYVEVVPEFEFYIPNTFTPNGDYINESFFGKCRGVKEYNIWIFDRWGNMLWDCHKQDNNTNWDNTGQDGLSSACKWDGKVVPGGVDMSGGSKQLSQEDVYVWKVKLKDVFDKVHTYVGNVNVVR